MKRRLFLQSSVAAAVTAALPVRAALAALAEVTGNVNAVTGDGAQVTLEQSAVPTDLDGNPLFRVESWSVLSCNRIQALVSVEPATRGVRAMQVGDFLFDWQVRNPDSVFGAAGLGFEVEFDPSRWDINRTAAGSLDRVDGEDLSWLAYSYGSREGEPFFNPDSDLSGDGIVDGEDLAYLAAGFGRCWSGTAWTQEACV